MYEVKGDTPGEGAFHVFFRTRRRGGCQSRTHGGDIPRHLRSRMQKDADIHARQFLAFLAALKKVKFFAREDKGQGSQAGHMGAQRARGATGQRNAGR